MGEQKQQYEKITEQELAELKEKREHVLKIRNNICDAHLTMEKCKTDLHELPLLHEGAVKTYNEIQQAILTKYGEVNVDLQTGILTYRAAN